MIRSILPCKNRETAREAKALTNREHRRKIREALRKEDPESTNVDLQRAAYQLENVGWRRSGDKLNHFLRWCERITEGMTTREALGFVRSILPPSVIGDHAYGHWERHIQPIYGRSGPYLRRAEEARRRLQSFCDSVTFRLRRALHIEPDLHARLNATIKSRKPFDQPRRLLQGMHDVAAFVADISREPYEIERWVTYVLIQEVEQKKGGRKAALRIFLNGERVHRRVAHEIARRDPNRLTRSDRCDRVVNLRNQWPDLLHPIANARKHHHRDAESLQIRLSGQTAIRSDHDLKIGSRRCPQQHRVPEPAPSLIAYVRCTADLAGEPQRQRFIDENAQRFPPPLCRSPVPRSPAVS